MPCELRERYHRDLGKGLQALSAAHGLLEGVHLIIRKGTKIFGVRVASDQSRSKVGVESDMLKNWVFFNMCLQMKINIRSRKC